MDFSRPYTLKELARFLNCDFKGNPHHQVLGANEIHVVRPGDLVFVDHPKYYAKALESEATTILIDKVVDVPKGKGLLIAEDPFAKFNQITRQFAPFQRAQQAIANNALIGAGTQIQPNCFIGNNVQIGKNCRIHSNVSLYDGVQIGNNVVIHANSVIGADAFYYKNRPEAHDQLLSGGTVIIQDNVHLGAGCTIDKGVTDSTVIGRGSKLDNQVQIGHDTKIGEKCLFASQVAVAGCTIIEDEVTLWGQVGVASGLRIGRKAVVLAQSGVAKPLLGGKTYFGSPAEEARKKWKEMASLRVLPKIIDHLEI
jgi:UDP-3-O-[3-hydroxymyristoyl] glucosamine N-acyltransferase